MTEKRVEMFDRANSKLFSVPAEDVFHIPANLPAKTRPIICEHYDPDKPKSCPYAKSGKCRFGHANLKNATWKLIHVNYALRSPKECQYPCLAPGKNVTVREPDSAQSAQLDVVPSECIIQTKCQFLDRPPSRCAHFYYGRECHLGNKCDFAHVIHLATDCNKGEKAPAPMQFGRGKIPTVEGEYYGENQYLLARNEAPPDPMPLFGKFDASVELAADLRDTESLGGSMIAPAKSPRSSGFNILTRGLPEASPENSAPTSPVSRAAAAPFWPPPAMNFVEPPPGTILLKPPEGFEFLGIGPC